MNVDGSRVDIGSMSLADLIPIPKGTMVIGTGNNQVQINSDNGGTTVTGN